MTLFQEKVNNGSKRKVKEPGRGTGERCATAKRSTTSRRARKGGDATDLPIERMPDETWF